MALVALLQFAGAKAADAPGFVLLPAKAPAVFNVRTYGAKGDRATKDTAAFQKALDDCALAGGGEVVVPAGNYLCGSMTLASNTTLHLEKDAFITESPDPADYPPVKVRFEGEMVDARRSLIYAEKASHIAILGPGGFYALSSLCQSNRTPRSPEVIEPVNCDDVRFEGFSLQYDQPVAAQRQQMWCIHPTFCTNVVIRNLFIRSQLSVGDGLDIDSCSKVLVENCDITTGDDAIGLKSGRGLAAVRLAKPTEEVVIRDCKLNSLLGSAIAFGTELSGGLRNISILHCVLAGRQGAIRFKSRNDRGGILENITGEDLTIDHAPSFITIDLLTMGTATTDPVTVSPDKWTLLRNLNFKNIKVDGVQTLIAGDKVSPERPIQGFTLANITGTCQKGIILSNVTNANFSGISFTGFIGNMATLTNVSGIGIDLLGSPVPKAVVP